MSREGDSAESRVRLSSRTYAARTTCMAKLERLDWPAGAAFDAYGVRIGLRTNDPSLLPLLITRLPPGSKPAASPIVDRMYSLVHGGDVRADGVRRYHLAYEDFVRLARTFDLDEALAPLFAELRLFVAANAPHRVFVHAGVVGWKGRAILIPGRSMSGKTTLVAELVRAGATYYSDEYAVIDARGLVHPYAKPLSMRVNGNARQVDTPVERFGGTAGTRPLPVGLVILSGYKDRGRWRPRSISPGAAAMGLLAHTVAARTRSRFALQALRKVVASAAALQGPRGEARETAEAILASI